MPWSPDKTGQPAFPRLPATRHAADVPETTRMSHSGQRGRRPNDICLRLERRGEVHGFLDSECGWIGDRLSLRFYAHGLSGGETAQGHRYPGAWLQIHWGNERTANPGEVACAGGAAGRRAERGGGDRLCPLVLSL